MSNFFTRHFGAITVGTIINLPALFKGGIWVTDWLARFDFWNTHAREIGGIAVMIGFLTDPPPWTVFFTSIAAVVIVLWDVRRQARAPEIELASDPAIIMKRIFFAGCTTIVVAVWAIAWPLYFPAKAVTAPPSPAPVAAPKPPPPPPPPWVSDAEFQEAKKAGRLLLPFTPEEISGINYSQGGDGTEPYVGKWVKINYPFMSIRQLTEKDKKEYLVLTVFQTQWPAYLVFDSKKWGEQLLLLKRGAIVKAICQLTKYDKGSYDMATPKFIGQNCELL